MPVIFRLDGCVTGVFSDELKAPPQCLQYLDFCVYSIPQCWQYIWPPYQQVIGKLYSFNSGVKSADYWGGSNSPYLPANWRVVCSTTLGGSTACLIRSVRAPRLGRGGSPVLCFSPNPVPSP